MLAALAAYRNSFSVPFFFDDRAQINDNPTIRHLWALRTVLVPPMNAGVGGRPLLNFSFAVNYALGGMHVWGYHALNLLIHGCGGVALFGIVRRTLDRMRGPGFQPVLGNEHGLSAHATILAFFVALLWLLHPLQTEAVTYVAERAESQMGMFYLLTLYGFIRYADESESENRKSEVGNVGPDRRLKFPLTAYRFPLFSVAACLFGIATKEVVVTAPVMVLLYDRTFVSGTFRAAWRRHWRVYAGYAGTWLLLAYLLANLQQRGVGFDLGGSWWDYALTESRVIVRYFCLAVWPHPLVFDYGMGVKRPGWEVLPYVVIVLGLVAGTAQALFGKNRNLRALGFAGAWVFIILAPTSSVVAVAGQPMAEHRMYLPLAAVIAVVVVLAARWGGRVRHSSAWRSYGGGVILAVVAVVLGILTFQRNAVYASEASIWSDTVAKQPDNERAHNGLGLVLAGSGDLAAAIGNYREAIRLNPDYPDAHQNLAAALETEGRVPEAVRECEETLRLRPMKPESHFNLGVALQLAGRSPEAIAQFDQALRLRPDYADAENNLGLALVSVARVSEAAGHFARAVHLQPGDAALRLNLGAALYNSGDITGAVREIETAIRLQPGYAEAHYNLAVLLGQMGRRQESEAEFAEAKRLGQKP